MSTLNVTVEVLTPDAVHALADGQRDPHWHSEFPAETDVALARLAVEQAAWSEPQILAIALDGVVIGTIALTPRGDIDDGWSVGYHVIEPLRGRGIATAAVLKVVEERQPLTAETDPANAASVRVLTKAGFQQRESSDPAVLQWNLGD